MCIPLLDPPSFIRPCDRPPLSASATRLGFLARIVNYGPSEYDSARIAIHRRPTALLRILLP